MSILMYFVNYMYCDILLSILVNTDIRTKSNIHFAP